jgi:glycosyltransferase involved in cell wall biosynthesis
MNPFVERILLVNKFYYPRGGDCIYTINLERLLRKQNHEVAIFSMQHPENLPSEWASYFPHEISYSPVKQGDLLESFRRPLGSKEVKTKFIRLLDDFKPDIVHLNNIHSQLSPVLAKIAFQQKIKVVWTLHDYKLLCPRYDCLKEGRWVCEKCFTGSKIHALIHRCTKGSIVASGLACLEALKWHREKLETYTACFICPSQFIKDKMIKGGFRKEKMNVLHNFIDQEKLINPCFEKSGFCCYVGRMSPEKGVETLLKAAQSLPYPLKLIGGGPQLEYLKSRYTDKHIEFCGKKNWDELKTILSHALFSILPSEWYENNPLAIIESLCLGTPVLGANIGGIPELVENKKNGLLFESGNVEDLKEKMIAMFDSAPLFDAKTIAMNAFDKYSAEKYYDQLIRMYKNQGY